MSIQSLVCWNEIRDVFFEKIFWKSSFLLKNPTHVIQNIQSLDCNVFWKQKLTRCKITWSEGACLMSFVVAYSGGGGGWEARWRPLQCFFFFGVKTLVPASSPSFFFFLFSLSRFCPFYLYASHLLFFFFSSVFSFFLSLFSFYSFFFLLLFLLPSSSALSSPVLIGKKHRERGLLPLSSNGTGVGWPGRPLCSRPRTAWGARPLCFSPRGRP